MVGHTFLADLGRSSRAFDSHALVSLSVVVFRALFDLEALFGFFFEDLMLVAFVSFALVADNLEVGWAVDSGALSVLFEVGEARRAEDLDTLVGIVEFIRVWAADSVAFVLGLIKLPVVRARSVDAFVSASRHVFRTFRDTIVTALFVAGRAVLENALAILQFILVAFARSFDAFFLLVRVLLPVRRAADSFALSALSLVVLITLDRVAFVVLVEVFLIAAGSDAFLVDDFEVFAALVNNTDVGFLVSLFVPSASLEVAVTLEEQGALRAVEMFADTVLQLVRLRAALSDALSVFIQVSRRAGNLEARSLFLDPTLRTVSSHTFAVLEVVVSVLAEGLDAFSFNSVVVQRTSADASASLFVFIKSRTASFFVAFSISEFVASRARVGDAVSIDSVGILRALILNTVISDNLGVFSAVLEDTFAESLVQMMSRWAGSSDTIVTNSLLSLRTLRELEADSLSFNSSSWAFLDALAILELVLVAVAVSSVAFLVFEDLAGRARGSDALSSGEFVVGRARGSDASFSLKFEVLFASLDTLVVDDLESIRASGDDTFVVDDGVDIAFALSSDAVTLVESEVFRTRDSFTGGSLLLEVFRAFDIGAFVVDLDVSAWAGIKDTFVVDSLVSLGAFDKSAASILILVVSSRAFFHSEAFSVFEDVSGIASLQDAMTSLLVSLVLSGTFFFGALSVGPEFEALVASELVAAIISLDVASRARFSDAFLFLLAELEVLVAAVSDASSLAVMFPSALAVEDAAGFEES